MSCQVKAHPIVCLHCTILDSSTVHLYSTAVVLIFYWCKGNSEETDAGTSSISEDFDKPPQKKRLSVSLIIYYGCQSIFDMERHCVLALSKITLSTACTLLLFRHTTVSDNVLQRSDTLTRVKLFSDLSQSPYCQEYERLKLGSLTFSAANKGSDWRVTAINMGYAVCNR